MVLSRIIFYVLQDVCSEGQCSFAFLEEDFQRLARSLFLWCLCRTGVSIATRMLRHQPSQWESETILETATALATVFAFVQLLFCEL